MEHTITGIIAANRLGKSTLAAAKLLLSVPIIPTDPTWPVFAKHGVTYRNWDNIDDTIWPLLREWIPKNELGDLVDYEAPKKTAFSVTLTCGTKIYFKCMAQPQGAFESQALDVFWWDEQGTEEKFIGANERVATRRGHHFFSLTPHRVEDRPDTGAGSWIHKLVTGEETKGMSNKFYVGDLIQDVPDWIYPETTKAEKIIQWETEPRRLRDRRKMREGQARLRGKWHVASGLVYGDFDPLVHVIDPFPIPHLWTCNRGLDHGRVNPEACVFGASNPDNDLFIYDEYLEVGKQVWENVEGIVRKSGNKLMTVGTARNGPMALRRRRELQCGRKFHHTALDARTYSRLSENGHLTLAKLYQTCGLRVVKASGKNLEFSIPLVADWFKIDEAREHYQTKKMGAPRIYIFRTCVKTIFAIEHYINEYHKGRAKNASEKPRQKDDHLPDALRYLVLSNPHYIEGFGLELEKRREWDEPPKRRCVTTCPYTGREYS
jgi:hypothetical protein